MVMRNAGSLVTIALLAGVACFLLPTPGYESFVVPEASRSSQDVGATPSALAQDFQLQARTLRVAAAAGLPPQPGDNGQPGKINLLFLGLLVGTAAIGLISLFAYGAYSGSGSSL
mmetsp:Transcript_20337/g.42155  ORF Transcript_20337/g.42155 Transcript_20337/m.42155 type:complete len:115 (+) Transcript_20337:70-414(+)